MSPGQDDRPPSNSGFTLIELLVVIGIMGILASIAVYSTQHIRGNATTSACKSDFKSIELAVDAYMTKYGSPPSTANLSDGSSLLGTAGLPKGGGNPPQYQFSVTGTPPTVSILPPPASASVVGSNSTDRVGILGCTAR